MTTNTRTYAQQVGARYAASAAGRWTHATCPQCGCLLKDKIEPCPECYRNQHQLVVCEGCGCLCKPTETCPGCKARRMAYPMAQPNPQRRAA